MFLFQPGFDKILFSFIGDFSGSSIAIVNRKDSRDVPKIL